MHLAVYNNAKVSEYARFCQFSEIFRNLVRAFFEFYEMLARFLKSIRVEREKCRKMAKSAQKSASIQPIFWYFKALRRILILWRYFCTLALCKIKMKIQDVLLENLQPALLRSAAAVQYPLTQLKGTVCRPILTNRWTNGRQSGSPQSVNDTIS